MTQHARVDTKLLGQLLNCCGISVEVHQPVTEKKIKSQQVSGCAHGQFKCGSHIWQWATYCPELKYCWCLLILCGRIRLPQFSNPRTTPPLSRTCKAEVLSKSCKLFCGKCVRVWFELRANDSWKQISHLDKIASSYADQFVKGHNGWTCVERIGAIKVIVNNFFFLITLENLKSRSIFLVHRCWEARTNFSYRHERTTKRSICMPRYGKNNRMSFYVFGGLIDTVM
jgi:hypothetical protein